MGVNSFPRYQAKLPGDGKILLQEWYLNNWKGLTLKLQDRHDFKRRVRAPPRLNVHAIIQQWIYQGKGFIQKSSDLLSLRFTGAEERSIWIMEKDVHITISLPTVLLYVTSQINSTSCFRRNLSRQCHCARFWLLLMLSDVVQIKNELLCVCESTKRTESESSALYCLNCAKRSITHTAELDICTLYCNGICTV